MLRNLFRENINNNSKEQFLLLSFSTLNLLKEAAFSYSTKNPNCEITLLTSCSKQNNNCLKSSNAIIIELKNNNIIDNNSQSFFDLKNETILMTGPLSYLFLQDINGKTLGSIENGLKSIIKGLGINNIEAEKHVNNLNKGGCLLIIKSTKK